MGQQPVDHGGTEFQVPCSFFYGCWAPPGKQTRESARPLARAQPLSVVRCLHIWFQFAPAMTIARAIVLQVKEYFYRLGNNSTGLGEKQTLSNE